MTEIHTPICVDCHLAMQMVEVGTNVIELAGTQFEYAYKLWSADKYRCPKCYKTVASGLTLVSQSHEKEHMVKVIAALRSMKVTYWHEKIESSLESYPGLCLDCGHMRQAHLYEGDDQYPCNSTAHRSKDPCGCERFNGR